MASFDKMFDSRKQDWRTPKSLFNRLNDIYHFTHDLAATPDNALCANYMTIEDNALEQSWDGITGFINPPFGERKYPMRKWIEKAYTEGMNDNTTIVLLLTVRSNTRAWHNYIMRSTHVMFIQGRVKFTGCVYAMPWPLCIVEFSPYRYTEYSTFIV